MKIVKLRPQYFRGFGDCEWIDLDHDIVLIYGPNGFGKSSMAEAVEWLIFGSTTRRRKGEDYSKTEYSGSYRNVHAGSEAETVVSAVVRMRSGEIHEIARKLKPSKKNDNESQTFVDGIPADFAEFSFDGRDSASPVIAQHGLQDFIHLAPKERRDFIGGALGLDELIGFRNTLEKARNLLRSSPPAAIVDAQLHITRGLHRIRQNPALLPLVSKWEAAEFDSLKDADLILKTANEALGTHWTAYPDRDVLLARLIDAREAAARSVLDLQKLQPKSATGIGESEMAEYTSAIDETSQALGQVLKYGTNQYAEALLRFWQVGLGLEGFSPPGCPMCGQPTLSSDMRQVLKDRIDGNQKWLGSLTELGRHAIRLVEALRVLGQAAYGPFPEFAEDNDMEKLQRLCADHTELVDQFIAVHAEVRIQSTTIQAALDRYCSELEELQHMAARPEGVEDCVKLLKATRGFADDLCGEIRSLQAAYDRVWTPLAPIAKSIVADTGTVSALESLIAAVGLVPYVSRLETFAGYMGDLLDDQRTVESLLQEEQKTALEDQGKAICYWYDLLNPSADVKYKDMEPATNTIRLLAESFGREISAPACLSQSQLNCLGISVRLMCAVAPGFAARFLIIDDPVQSMDDEHVESFKNVVVPELIDKHGFQVIILSHLGEFIERMSWLNNHRNKRRYTITSFEEEGPCITVHQPLRDLFADIRRMSRSNEAHRKMALDRIRVASEQLIRDLYALVNKKPLDSSYDDATASKLLPVFQQLPDVSPAEFQGLKDTIDFANPSHHTPTGWMAPSRSQIEPHLGRLEQLARSHGL